MSIMPCSVTRVADTLPNLPQLTHLTRLPEVPRLSSVPVLPVGDLTLWLIAAVVIGVEVLALWWVISTYYTQSGAERRARRLARRLEKARAARRAARSARPAFVFPEPTRQDPFPGLVEVAPELEISPVAVLAGRMQAAYDLHDVHDVHSIVPSSSIGADGRTGGAL